MTTNAELLARRNAAVPRGVGHATPVYAARAENAEVWDVEGRRYVDFAGGIAVLNTGHRHPKVMAAVAEGCRVVKLFPAAQLETNRRSPPAACPWCGRQ